MELKMDNAKSSRFLTTMMLLFLCGAFVFLVGFFPISSHSLERFVNDDNRPTDIDGISIKPPTKVYEQTIMLLIDALRHDFATAENMPFGYGNSCGVLKLQVSTPTVTMPRLKSLMTGTVSDFIDIVLNIGHVEKLSDSLVHRLVTRGDALVFAGDRTWVNLFPKKFTRAKANMDSFYVNDFYEGDLNVTREMERELQQNDWTLMILHYLGLDHIGHVEGSVSDKIWPKLKEMDLVIHKIYKAKRFRNQLLLVTGDHGMRDGGGHGGSTGPEIYVPLLMFRENCTARSSITKTNEYNQIDLAPTLAILLSIEIPNVSVGCLIPELLEDLSPEQQLYAYYYNTLHLMRKAGVQFGHEAVNASAYSAWFAEAKAAHKRFLEVKSNSNVHNAFVFENAKLGYMRTAREISSQLSDSLVHFDYGLISIGLALTTLVVVYTLATFIVAHTTQTQQKFRHKQPFFIAITIAACINIYCHYVKYIELKRSLYSALLMIPLTASIYIMLMLIHLVHKSIIRTGTFIRKQKIVLPWPLIACLGFQTLSLASSSYIELEYLTWYYLGSSVLIWLSAQVFRRELRLQAASTTVSFKSLLRQAWRMRLTMLLLMGLLLLHKIHCVGLALKKPSLSVVFGAGLILLFLHFFQHASKPQLACAFVALLCVYCYQGLSGKVVFFMEPQKSNIAMFVVFWIAIAALMLFSVQLAMPPRDLLRPREPVKILITCLQSSLMIILLISALLHRPQNVILVAALVFTLNEAYRLCDFLLGSRSRKGYVYTVLQKTICTILIANMFFNYQGNSNSFATIDLNPGYIGQSSYNPVVVGLFVTLNMYSAPISGFLFLAANVLKSSCPHDSAAVKREDVVAQPQKAMDNLWFVLYFYTIATLLPIALYLWLLVFFRYHLFIYSVFAPKALYECYRAFVLYLVLIITNVNLSVL